MSSQDLADAQAHADEADAGNEPPAPNVIVALTRVMRDLPGIGRDLESDAGYQYRGIEQITRHAQALFARHGVVFVPSVEHRDEIALTINNRPWTEQRAVISYTVYGPGGPDDKILVGPLIAQGRDNSDKGMNKCMTQAFKYALLQTLCIGDAKDDADAGPANEADAPREADPLLVARRDTSARIKALGQEARDEVRSWMDQQSIPRTIGRWSEEMLDRLNDRLDAYDDPAAQVPQDESAAPTEPEGSPEGATGDVGVDPVPPCPCGQPGVGVFEGTPFCADHGPADEEAPAQ